MGLCVLVKQNFSCFTLWTNHSKGIIVFTNECKVLMTKKIYFLQPKSSVSGIQINFWLPQKTSFCLKKESVRSKGWLDRLWASYFVAILWGVGNNTFFEWFFFHWVLKDFKNRLYCWIAWLLIFFLKKWSIFYSTIILNEVLLKPCFEKKWKDGQFEIRTWVLLDKLWIFHSEP